MRFDELIDQRGCCGMALAWDDRVSRRLEDLESPVTRGRDQYALAVRTDIDRGGGPVLLEQRHRQQTLL